MNIANIEIVGLHLGTKTKFTNPWDFDPLLQFSNGQASAHTVYSDRLARWHPPAIVKELKQKHFGSESDYYSDYTAEKLQDFLRELMSKPSLVLNRVEEHCNVSSGYSVWRFDYNDGT